MWVVDSFAMYFVLLVCGWVGTGKSGSPTTTSGSCKSVISQLGTSGCVIPIICLLYLYVEEIQNGNK